MKYLNLYGCWFPCNPLYSEELDDGKPTLEACQTLLQLINDYRKHEDRRREQSDDSLLGYETVFLQAELLLY